MAYEPPQLRERPPLPPSPYRTQERESSSGGNLGKYAVAFGFFVALAAMLGALMLFQLTSEGTAKTTLRRSIAALSEIDTLIDRQYDDLQARAQSAQDNETLLVEDFPVAVLLAPSDVRGASREQLRATVLDRAANVLYTRGAAPLRENAANGTSADRFSGAGLSYNALGVLRERNHNVFGVLTFVLVALSAALGVTLAVMCRGFGRIGGVGAVVLLVSVPFALVGIAARFRMRIASDADTEYIQREFIEIGEALAWIAIRNGLAFLVLGLVFVTLGIAGGRLIDRAEQR